MSLAQGRLVEVGRDTRPGQGGFYAICPESPTPKPARNAVIEWVLSQAGKTGPPTRE